MTDENTHDIPDMTDAEYATAYLELRKRANDAGFATVGEWIDEQPDTDELADELEACGGWGKQQGGVWPEGYRECYMVPGELRERILTALRTDRKAVLEEAACIAEDEFFASAIAHAIRALAEGDVR